MIIKHKASRGFEALREHIHVLFLTREKGFSKTSFQLRMELKKGHKQGRDEGMQEDYPTSAKINRR